MRRGKAREKQRYQIEEIRRMFAENVPTERIARVFGVDGTTVLYFCGHTKRTHWPRVERQPKPPEPEKVSSPANQGRSYFSYLKEQKKAIRDERGNVLGYEFIHYTKPKNYFTLEE